MVALIPTMGKFKAKPNTRMHDKHETTRKVLWPKKASDGFAKTPFGSINKYLTGMCTSCTWNVCAIGLQDKDRSERSSTQYQE